MKITELLEQIAPLPWPDRHDHDDAPDFEHQPNWDYARHCANVLPKLVVAIKAHLVSGNQPTRQALEAALAAAEEIK